MNKEKSDKILKLISDFCADYQKLTAGEKDYGLVLAHHNEIELSRWQQCRSLPCRRKEKRRIVFLA